MCAASRAMRNESRNPRQRSSSGVVSADAGAALEGAGLDLEEWAREEAAEGEHAAMDAMFAKDKDDDKKDDKKENKKDDKKDDDKDDKKDDDKDDKAAFQARPIRQNQSIGRQRMDGHFLAGGMVVRFPQILESYGACWLSSLRY